MITINVQGLLYTTRAALPHLLLAAEQGPRRVADVVNISSIASRVAWNGYNLTKFGVKGFTESLRQDSGYVRVGVVEPGGVATELGSHNRPEIRTEMIDHVADPRTGFRMITTLDNPIVRAAASRARLRSAASAFARSISPGCLEGSI